MTGSDFIAISNVLNISPSTVVTYTIIEGGANYQIQGRLQNMAQDACLPGIFLLGITLTQPYQNIAMGKTMEISTDNITALSVTP